MSGMTFEIGETTDLLGLPRRVRALAQVAQHSGAYREPQRLAAPLEPLYLPAALVLCLKKRQVQRLRLDVLERSEHRRFDRLQTT